MSRRYLVPDAAWMEGTRRCDVTAVSLQVNILCQLAALDRGADGHSVVSVGAPPRPNLQGGGERVPDAPCLFTIAVTVDHHQAGEAPGGDTEPCSVRRGVKHPRYLRGVCGGV